jgi:hypothetical protein
MTWLWYKRWTQYNLFVHHQVAFASVYVFIKLTQRASCQTNPQAPLGYYYGAYLHHQTKKEPPKWLLLNF